jgi:hypothetical protein
VRRLLAHLGPMPPQVRFLLTSRSDARVLAEIAVPPFDLIANAPDGTDDVRDYAYRRLTVPADPLRGELADRVAAAGGGNFLYARYVLDDLLPRIDQFPDLGYVALPNKLDGVYRDFLKRDLGRSGNWKRNRRIFGALAVARGRGLSRSQLSGVSGLDLSDTDEVLQSSSQFLSGARPELGTERRLVSRAQHWCVKAT